MSESAAETISTVMEAQRAWARRHGYPLTSDQSALQKIDLALFEPLTPSTHAALAAGAGNELSRLASLRSSACLAINVFQPWRLDPQPILDALKLPGEATGMRFEVQVPTGLQGKPPHLDVVIDGTTPVGIECKFLETYDTKRRSQASFAPSYFSSPGLWRTMRNARTLAERIASGTETFEWLDAPQLLKHALGLSRAFEQCFRLALVWFEADTNTKMHDDIRRFQAAIDGDFGLMATSYQDLIARLRRRQEPAKGYFRYLADRYGFA